MKKLIAIAVLLAAAQQASAIQNIKLGTMEIKPFVSTEGKYDDNIYLSSADLKSAWINNTVAGFTLNQKFSRLLEIEGGYNIGLVTYSRDHSANNTVNHDLELNLKSELPRDTTVRLGDEFIATADPATSEETTRAKRNQNVAAFRLESPLRGNFGFEINAQHTNQSYLSSTYNNLDRGEMLVGGNLIYRLQPKTQAFLGYTYGNLNYVSANNDDAVYNNFTLGLRGKMTATLSGSVSVDTQVRHYGNDQVVSGQTASNNGTTVGYGAQLKWLASPDSSVTLFGARRNIESSYQLSRYYVSTLTDIAWNHRINKFSSELGFSMESVYYPEATPATGSHRSDDNSMLRVNLGYDIQKWLTLTGGYNYRSRTSNEKDYQYEDNIFLLSLKAQF